MPSRFSQDIKSLLERLGKQPLTLADIIAETSERGFSLVIAIMVLPFLFPMPPGFYWCVGISLLPFGYADDSRAAIALATQKTC